MILRNIKSAFLLFIVLSLLTGFVYPLAVLGIAQGLFPYKANGSIIKRNGKTIGSELIGQNFKDPKYFWSRPSATPIHPYNTFYSSASNYSQSNIKLLQASKEYAQSLRMNDISNVKPIPVDLVTASGSGLDPDISPLAAFYQIPRISMLRRISENEIHGLVERCIEDRTFKILGEPRVNVLKLNMLLDEYQPRIKIG